MNKDFWSSNVGVDKNIRSHILSNSEMSDLGFTHYSDDGWYFYRMVGDGVSLNVLAADDDSFLGLRLLEEDHFQPLDLNDEVENMHMSKEEADNINREVNKWMRYLEGAGVIEGYI